MLDLWLFCCDSRNFIKVYSFGGLTEAKKAHWKSWELRTPCASAIVRTNSIFLNLLSFGLEPSLAHIALNRDFRL